MLRPSESAIGAFISVFKMTDLHEASFVWPDTNPQDVILTGSFDQWSASIHLSKTITGFEGKVKVPWEARVPYKFIVDGKWMTLRSQPEEFDNLGNLNNIYYSPSCPEIPKDEATTDHFAPVTHDTPIFPDDNDQHIIINDPNSSEGGMPDIPPKESRITSECISPALEESTSASPPSAPFELLVSPSPPTDLHPNLAIEPVISPEPGQQTLPPNPPQLPTIPVSPNTPLESESTHIEVTLNGATNPVNFPKSEEKSTDSNVSVAKLKPKSNISNSISLVKPEAKQNAPSTVSLESESRASSVALTSAPSSPASHFRTASEPRQRNVSSKSDSVRSDAKRSKRHSIFGKVKHLFHLDKDT
ncbi:hypothetical protein Clacol_001599 [Clathrus columnatus]|uniref:AMP-activated protein kinase glycogen-binding domain-containing protein n=1 Tax=Clathrus columnatus TaxID=1419009 RepID=A0AAV4ZYL1_9AGAM|nr:hypothetical protein Clacol_001599 [Clathrus columnatus]